MTTYRCTVKRMQVWYIEVEADTREQAKEKAEHAACLERPDDDYSYDTKAEES